MYEWGLQRIENSQCKFFSIGIVSLHACLWNKLVVCIREIVLPLNKKNIWWIASISVHNQLAYSSSICSQYLLTAAAVDINENDPEPYYYVW